MEPIDKLRKQHEDILSVADQLGDGLATASNTQKAGLLCNLIEQLAGLLEEHLLLEDEFLYPILKKRPDEGVRDIAFQFSIELGNIKSAFAGYIDKWSSAGNIVQSYPQFVSESKALLGALQTRIVKEDNDLFPLV